MKPLASRHLGQLLPYTSQDTVTFHMRSNQQRKSANGLMQLER